MTLAAGQKLGPYEIIAPLGAVHHHRGHAVRGNLRNRQRCLA